jgi:short-subunit dehydrogenase
VSGRVVVVTGASSGIGEATARAFGRAGDRVVLVARRAGLLERLAAELPESLVVPADLTQVDDLARVVDRTRARFGDVDVLVNNAGAGRYDWLEELSEDDIRTQIRLNLTAPILLTRAVLPMMLRRRSGVIINVGSVAGRIAAPTLSIYNATKYGLDGFTEALRREVGPQGIAVCIIYPGPVGGTEFGQKSRRVSVGVRTPSMLQRTVDQVASAILDLADHPRPRRVLPGIFGVAIAINALAPSLVDAAVARATRRAQQSRRRPS